MRYGVAGETPAIKKRQSCSQKQYGTFLWLTVYTENFMSDISVHTETARSNASSAT